MGWLTPKAQNNATVTVETGSKIGPYFDWDKGKIGINIPIPNLRGGFANKDFNIDFSADRLKGDVRSQMQGTTMALADEIEANVRSVFSSKPKAEILASIRDQIQKFRSENPKAAISKQFSNPSSFKWSFRSNRKIPFPKPSSRKISRKRNKP